jgi:hypothetical protein
LYNNRIFNSHDKISRTPPLPLTSSITNHTLVYSGRCQLPQFSRSLTKVHHSHPWLTKQSKWILSEPYHINHITSTISYQPYHINHIISTISYQLYHINYIISTISYQPHHINYIISTISHQLYHINHIISTISYQLYHINHIISTISYQPYHIKYFRLTKRPKREV